MMSSVIVHIGPPKTATTSLQIALEKVSHSNFFYGGTFQPRARNAGGLCQRLYHVCSSQSENDIEVEAIRDELRTLLSKGKTVFLSEEMFLIEQEKASVREKIIRLRSILKDFNCKILISARLGQSALPSFYQEIFNSLPLSLQFDFPAFCRDKRSASYDYAAVCKMLKELDFDDILIIEFEKLANERFSLKTLTENPIFEENFFTLQRHNIGKSRGNENDRVLPAVSLKSLGRLKPVQAFIKILKIRNWPSYHKIIGILNSVTLRGPGARSLQVPQDVANRLEKSYCEAVNCYGRSQKDSGVSLK